MSGLRVLWSFVGGMGHFAPLAYLARAAGEAGHDALFACGPGMAAAVRAAGFEVEPVGAASGAAPERQALLAPDAQREERDLRERFVRRAARDRLPLLSALLEAQRPDLLVCDETDFGAMLAAERAGLPWASVQVIASGAFVRPDVVGEALAELRAEAGLPADPSLEMLHRYLVVSPFPESFRSPEHPAPATVHPVRPEQRRDAGAKPLDLELGRPGAPLVYLTLGTVFNLESGDLLERALAGLRGLPVNVVATVGPGIDPAELSEQPAWVRVLRYRPQHELLPHCSAVVSHAGSGSLVGALAYGLPSLLLPLGADQLANAARAQALGVARVLDPVRATPEEIAAGAASVLGDSRLRVAAEKVEREISELPPISRGVALLEQLAATRAPLLRESQGDAVPV